MTEEELRKAADEYTSSDKIRYIQDATDRDVEDAFVEGAEWALEHQWNDVNKSLPDYEKDVIVTTDGKDCWFSHRSKNVDVMKDSHGFASFNWKEVMYWMEIPILKVK